MAGTNLSALCNLACGISLESARQHVSPRSLAGVTDERVSLHGPDDGVGRHRNMDHDRPALGTMRSVVDSVARRHDRAVSFGGMPS